MQPKRRLVASALRSPPNLWREAGLPAPRTKATSKRHDEAPSNLEGSLALPTANVCPRTKGGYPGSHRGGRHVLWNGVYLSGTGRMCVNYPMITPRPHSQLLKSIKQVLGIPFWPGVEYVASGQTC